MSTWQCTSPTNVSAYAAEIWLHHADACDPLYGIHSACSVASFGLLATPSNMLPTSVVSSVRCVIPAALFFGSALPASLASSARLRPVPAPVRPEYKWPPSFDGLSSGNMVFKSAWIDPNSFLAVSASVCNAAPAQRVYHSCLRPSNSAVCSGVPPRCWLLPLTVF